VVELLSIQTKAALADTAEVARVSGGVRVERTKRLLEPKAERLLRPDPGQGEGLGLGGAARFLRQLVAAQQPHEGSRPEVKSR
jgi:FAD/FMN-containing dehydrogenase